MMHSEILKPVVVLAGWTLVMLVWAVVMRMGAMRRAGIDMGTLIGTTAHHADKALPAQIQWKAHNYNHLTEQPTLFYAIALVLALIGQGDGVNAAIAWTYVALRIAHSLWQATVNRVRVRFWLFGLSSITLAALTLHAALAVFG